MYAVALAYGAASGILAAAGAGFEVVDVDGEVRIATDREALRQISIRPLTAEFTAPFAMQNDVPRFVIDQRTRNSMPSKSPELRQLSMYSKYATGPRG
jgi:hypothetical protein